MGLEANMKINDVQIINWESPGDKWWASVEARPSEPLIEATITLTLSWAEYHELLDRHHRGDMTGDASPVAVRLARKAGFEV